MYDIGVYGADIPHQLGIFTRVVNRGNYNSAMYNGCVGVPLPIITQREMKPVFLVDRTQLETYFEDYGTDVYESGKYRQMARMIVKNGAIPYLMPYPMETEVGMVSSQVVYGGSEKVSLSIEYVDSADKTMLNAEKAAFLDALNGATATARYVDKKLNITVEGRSGCAPNIPKISGTVDVGGYLEGEFTIGYKFKKEDTKNTIEIKCKYHVHLKGEIKGKNSESFTLGGGAFDVNYDKCKPSAGSYACTLLTGKLDIDSGLPLASMLMYPGYGSASSTVWYVLTITDKDKENYKITFAKYDASIPNKISMIKSIESVGIEGLTWKSLVSSNLIPYLSCGDSIGEVNVAPGKYVFTARGILGGYKKWVSHWVEHLRNAPAFIATQVCIDWKYFTNEINDRNAALKEFEEYVLKQYKSENINTTLVVDEDLVKGNYANDPVSMHDSHLVVCKLRNSTESELLTCAVAACLSASGCETATARELEVSELSDPSAIIYYDSPKIKNYSKGGAICLHKITGVSNPVIYHDITSYIPAGTSINVDFVRSRGYAVRTIGKLINDIGVMYNSQYVGRLRNNTTDMLKSDVYAICKRYGESNYIMLMEMSDIVINADPHAETIKIILPIQISPYVETVLLTISI